MLFTVPTSQAAQKAEGNESSMFLKMRNELGVNTLARCDWVRAW
jgi:hypothetical protein